MRSSPLVAVHILPSSDGAVGVPGGEGSRQRPIAAAIKARPCRQRTVGAAKVANGIYRPDDGTVMHSSSNTEPAAAAIVRGAGTSDD